MLRQRLVLSTRAPIKRCLFQPGRHFSVSPNSPGTDVHSNITVEQSTAVAVQSESVDATLTKLFEEQDVSSLGEIGSAAADATSRVVWDPVWYNFADQAILGLRAFHEFTGFEYGWSIVGITALLRVALFPIMITAQRTTSRMAHLQPQLTQMKNRYEALGTPSRQDQLQFSKNMQALFSKYDVKPFRAVLTPLVQLPLFMGMFFGLKKMPGIFPDELANGGILWFPDLTLTDPLYILPMSSAFSFLLLIEIGKDQMLAQNPAQGQLMVNIFRMLSLTMIPVCLTFDSAMLCYWTANNTMTVAQTLLLKSDAVRDKLGIWEPPKPIPGQEPESLTDVVTNLSKRVRGEATNEKERVANHNRAVQARNIARKALQGRRNAPSRKSGITGTRN